MDSKFNTLSVEQVTAITNQMAPEIKEAPAVYNYGLLNKLRIKVFSGIEFQQTQMVFRRKGGITRRYDPAATDPKQHDPQVGYLEERKLETTLFWLRPQENIQSFREKEPFSVIGTNGTYDAPVTQNILRAIGQTFASDSLANVWWGDKDLGLDSPYGLFDGINKKISQDIIAGRVGASLGNYIATGPFVRDPESAPGAAYQKFLAFYEGLSSELRAQPELLIYASQKTFFNIVYSYLKEFPGFQASVAKEGDISSFKFFALGNVTMISHPLFGEGSRLIATVPDNFHLGVDSLNSSTMISVNRNPWDQNVLIFQVQNNMGTRVLDVSPKYFAINDQTNTPDNTVLGDYIKSGVTVSSNDESLGTVSVSPVKEEYAKGETITLTATAETAGKFVKWSDGATLSPRTIVFSGTPEVYQAIFDAADSE